MDFHFNDDKKLLIGLIVYENTINLLTNEEIREVIKRTSQLEVFLENFKPYEMMSLPNGQILVVNSSSISLYDENFKLIRTKEYNILSCTLSDKKEIYAVDSINHCVYKIDLNLNLQMKFGSYGSDNDQQFSSPKSIFWINDYFYVDDDGNNRIQIFDLNFDYVDTISKMNYKLDPIKISKKAIGVSKIGGVFFTDLFNPIEIKKDYVCCGKLNFINSIFYVVSQQNRTLWFFDENGKYLEEINLEILTQNIEKWQDLFIFCHKKNLFFSVSNCLYKLC